MTKKLTTEEFIQKAKQVHGNIYEYNKTIYKNSRTKVAIKCKKHGIFYQEPSSHLRGNGCPTCAKENNRKTVEQFIIDATKIHQNLYDYSAVIYKDSKSPVSIKCNKCGNIFKQSPNSHLRGQGCPKCAVQKIQDKVSYTQEEWINKAILVHNNKYDYSKVIYKGSGEKVCIVCPIHGEFLQKAASHLFGSGCPECAKLRQGPTSKTTEQFIEDAKKVHGDKYDYSKTIYTNNITAVTIICPKHGEFQQKPSIHLRGSGCPKCKSSKKELFIKELLENLNIDFRYQKKITYQKLNMRVDFYLELNNKKLIIEYNGEQHYKSIKFFGGDAQFEKQQRRDQLLREYCNINNITLIEIKYTSSKDEITNFIKNLIQ